MTAFSFSAAGLDFGVWSADTQAQAQEKFSHDSGYASWAAMVAQAEEFGGNNVEVREIDETPCRADLIYAVRQHALALYEQGWDVIEECYSDDDLDYLIGEATTADEAIASVAAARGLNVKRLEGFVLTTKDVDGTSRNAYADLTAAAERFKDMSGRELTDAMLERLAYGESVTQVSDYGTVVSLRYTGRDGIDDRDYHQGHQREYNPDNFHAI